MQYLWLATCSLAFGGNKMFKCKTHYMGVLFAFRKNIWCMHTNYLLFLEIAADLCITNNLSTIFFKLMFLHLENLSSILRCQLGT